MCVDAALVCVAAAWSGYLLMIQELRAARAGAVLAKVAIRASGRDIAIDRTGLRIFPPLVTRVPGGAWARNRSKCLVREDETGRFGPMPVTITGESARARGET